MTAVMHGSKRESGRLLIAVVLLVGLSAGAVYWKSVVDAPENLYREGLSAFTQRAFPSAASAWQEAARLGHLQATSRLAGLHLEGQGVSRNHKRAFELFEEAAKRGDSSAQLELARLYAAGRGVAPNPEQAVLWFWEAAKNQDVEAQLELGRIYAEGRGVERDYDQAAHWYQQAAEVGFAEAQLSLGLLHHEGHTSLAETEAQESAGHWFTRAAEDANLPGAWYWLGRYHEQGLGGFQKDVTQAVWCYEQAIKDEHIEALYRLGRMYEHGWGVEKSPDKAAAHFYRAATQGHAESQYLLARAYELGEGARREPSKAKTWYGRAAEQGHVDAMAALQDMSFDSMKLTRSERRRLEKKRREADAKQETQHVRSMRRPGRCEVYSPSGPVVEMRTKQDCLNRGGDFKDSTGGSQGGFSTVETEKDWGAQRRDLKRRQREQSRLERNRYEGGDDDGYTSTDWVACYSRGSRDRSGRAHYSCSSAVRKTRETTTSWCRERGFQTRRLFKHQSSARGWISENCW
jgi:TPR repeat protein